SDIADNPEIARWVDSVGVIVNGLFYNTCGANLKDTVTFLDNDIKRVVDEQGGMELGDLIAAGYRKAAIENLEKIDSSDVVGLVPYGVIREGLSAGVVTYNNVFNVLPLGGNANGHTGYPLVYAYLNGDELEDVCEMNATLAPYIEDVRMFFSGLEYETGKWRLPFFKVKKVFVNGKPVQKDKLYLVVTGEYTAKLVGTLKRESYGILSAKLKDKNGVGVDISNLPVIKSKSGNIITEWLSFARYLGQRVK
ncbi:MAG: 5'-nucleotidase C-terminal domain-containing protein, partial [Bacteroidia bacterium]|nr:5'-nucleotidase C-terminal domain-containing protein [Bacteroidia bacterium]